MFFKLDENTPWVLKILIEQQGDHQVDSVYHQSLTGISDNDLIAHCFTENKVLITLDHDFMNAFLYPQDKHKGIIILCPLTQGKKAVKELFERFLAKYSLDETSGKVIIVFPTEIKIRS
ncbi:MAG: DUF5615 family PIN-like protein [Candidatus Helarchaeota archaeon]